MANTVKCRNCGKEIQKELAYKVGKASYYCDINCYNEVIDKRNKNKRIYEPGLEAERREYTDYIQKIYLENGYDKSEIPWTLLMSQTKNILLENTAWSYVTLQYILSYMYEILCVDLFAEESNGSILSLLPFYGIEAEQYFRKCENIKEQVEYFEFPEEIIVTRTMVPNNRRKKYIDMTNL